ncbi:Transcriptional regulator WhiB [Kutzneria sp. CA-103260]|nr:Transcriptional regulator WhiB [Kutzneria sp. CA-103260]
MEIEGGRVVEAAEIVNIGAPVREFGLLESGERDFTVLDGVFDGDDEEQEWQERALCAQTDPEAFFPEKGGSTREAKRICQGCEVRSECLEYALAHDERFGIWGGLSERERRKLKKRPA